MRSLQARHSAAEFAAVLHPVRVACDGDFIETCGATSSYNRDLPWGRFVQSAVLHAAALGLIWVVSLSWMRQQKILDRAEFDRSSLITYTPQEYLPPLDTGAPEAGQGSKGRSRLRKAADSFGSTGGK